MTTQDTQGNLHDGKGRFSNKSFRDADTSVIQSPAAKLAEAYPVRDYTADDIARLRRTSTATTYVANPPEPDQDAPAFVDRFRTVNDAMGAEGTGTEYGTYAELNAAQKRAVKTITDAVAHAQQHAREPKKHYEVYPLPNGNTAVYIDIARAHDPFAEVFNRVELDENGEVLAHHLAFMQGGKWARIHGTDDAARYFMNSPFL